MQSLQFNWAVALRLVGYLGWCVCTYFASLLAWTLLSKKRPSHVKRWIRLIASWKTFKEKGTLRLNEMWLAGIFAAFCLVILGMGYDNLKSPVVVEHNVKIYGQLPDGDWVMASDEDGSLVFRPCRDDAENGVDVNGLLTQGKGYIADVAVWEERGTCKSILRKELGFWFRTKKNNYQFRRFQ